jgi:hypothetical protein
MEEPVDPRLVSKSVLLNYFPGQCGVRNESVVDCDRVVASRNRKNVALF